MSLNTFREPGAGYSKCVDEGRALCTSPHFAIFDDPLQSELDNLLLEALIDGFLLHGNLPVAFEMKNI